MPTYTVVKAEQKKTINGQHGELVVWGLTLRNGDGKEAQVETVSKPTTTYSEGQSVEGEVSNSDYGLKFKRAMSGGGGFRGGGRSPADTKAIQRQHSQEMALRLLSLEAQLGARTTVSFDEVSKLADQFDRDIANGKAAA